LLFSESQGRILVSVAAERADEFESRFEGLPLVRAGTVTNSGRIELRGTGGDVIINAGLDELGKSYRGVFEGF
jgi:phosphoribosylformylglycinamidine (FGAM) synthase-like enzyme